MTEKVFGDYDQETLDAAYNAGAAVPNYAEWVERYEEASKQALADIPGPRDIQYGSHRDEVLDIFPAEGTGRPGKAGPPVHLFIHGGYWRAFYKDRFACVAQGLQPLGATTMVMSYTLCPEVTMDVIVHQCRAAIAWIWKTAAGFGADPDRIYVSGHSAGGHLTAMLLGTDWEGAYDIPNNVIKGATPISGLFDLRPIRHTYLQPELHLDDVQVARNSPVDHPPVAKTPVIGTYGADETAGFAAQWDAYRPVLEAAGCPVEFLEMPGHDHFSIFWELTKSDSPLTQAIARQMGLI